MGKQINEEVFIMRFKLTRAGDVGEITVSEDDEYIVTSDDLKETRIYSPTLTSSQRTAVINLAMQRVQEIKQLEG